MPQSQQRSEPTDVRDSHTGPCCSICGRVLAGTKWFCTSDFRLYGLDTPPWPDWVRYLKQREAARRRQNSQERAMELKDV